MLLKVPQWAIGKNGGLASCQTYKKRVSRAIVTQIVSASDFVERVHRTMAQESNSQSSQASCFRSSESVLQIPPCRIPSLIPLILIISKCVVGSMKLAPKGTNYTLMEEGGSFIGLRIC